MRHRLMQICLAVMLVMLVVQFATGMYLNLFVELPKDHPGSTGSYAPSIPWALAGNAGAALAVHVLLWIVLTLGGITLLILGIMSRRPAIIVGNVLGFLFLLTAGSGGLGFLNRASEVESYVMAGGFILAFIAYGAALFKASLIRPSAPGSRP